MTVEQLSEIPGSGAQLVGEVRVQCPACPLDVPVPIYAWLDGDSGQQFVMTASDMTDLWAHMFIHYEEP